ncbi:MAG TPA: SGNH/GDSL hydrolase family protein [Burkholderiales bacterium]|nr:SGNH/GDSL hydrolase family protein [Burkholderiales bacterium]
MSKLAERIVEWTCAGALALALAAPALAQPAPRLVVFGDSLSDPGNAFALAGGTNTPPDYSVDFFLVPSQPYARGGHHFTNGDTWIELLARARGMNANAQPAFRSNAAGAANYAIGGARARDDGTATSLSRQVDAFLGDTGGGAPGGALYVIEVGGNDIRDIAQTRDPTLAAAALGAIQANIARLHGAGARTFLVWNAPKVAATPAIRMADAALPGTAQAVDGVTLQYNAGLAQVLSGLEAALPGVRFVRYDVYAALAAIAASPAAFGLTNVTDPCIRPNLAPFFCQAPRTYLFWDGIHPTEAGHAIIADQVGKLLGP